MADERKPSVTLKVDPSILQALEDLARKEDRTRSKIGEMLLKWSLSQLRIAGSFDALMESHIAPPQQSAKQGIERLRKAQANLAGDQKKKIG
jgi:hypothetical protein